MQANFEANVLSAPDALQLLEIATGALQCDSAEALRSAVMAVHDLIGSDAAVCAYEDQDAVRSDGDVFAEVVNAGYPESYLAEYVAKRYHFHDVVLQEFLATGALQNIQEVEKRRGLILAKNVVRQLDLDHGLVDGFGCGIVSPGQKYCSILFFAGRSVENCDRSRVVLEYLAPHLSEALRRLIHPVIFAREARLTASQIEVLRWVAAGKTSWEIAHILGRSQRVINYHVAEAMRRLGATTRAHAVAIAVANGLIELDF